MFSVPDPFEYLENSVRLVWFTFSSENKIENQLIFKVISDHIQLRFGSSFLLIWIKNGFLININLFGFQIKRWIIKMILNILDKIIIVILFLVFQFKSNI